MKKKKLKNVKSINFNNFVAIFVLLIDNTCRIGRGKKYIETAKLIKQ